jgi:hypothetical protein
MLPPLNIDSSDKSWPALTDTTSSSELSSKNLEIF